MIKAGAAMLRLGFLICMLAGTVYGQDAPAAAPAASPSSGMEIVSNLTDIARHPGSGTATCVFRLQGRAVRCRTSLYPFLVSQRACQSLTRDAGSRGSH